MGEADREATIYYKMWNNCIIEMDIALEGFQKHLQAKRG